MGDAHLGTLAFSNDNDDNNKMKSCILKIREFLKNYDSKMKAMMNVQANIHSILNEMKIENDNNENKNSLRNKNRSKSVHGIGGGAFGFNSEISNENDPNLYKDYVVEYIKL